MYHVVSFLFCCFVLNKQRERLILGLKNKLRYRVIWIIKEKNILDGIRVLDTSDKSNLGIYICISQKSHSKTQDHITINNKHMDVHTSYHHQCIHQYNLVSWWRVRQLCRQSHPSYSQEWSFHFHQQRHNPSAMIL